MLEGIYTAGIMTYTPTVATEVATPYTTGGNNAPVCVAMADVTGGTLTINRGTWNGVSFTVVQRIALITAGTATVSVPIFYVTLKDEALQIILSAGSGHVRVQGNIVKVA